MSKGVLFIAENNEEIDYIKIAIANSLLVRRNLNVPVALATSHEDKTFEKYFDEVICYKAIDHKTKKYYMTETSKVLLTWNNRSRVFAYDYTPFEETLLLDVDYLIFDDSLNAVWESKEPVMMNHKAEKLLGGPWSLQEERIQDSTIPLFWATAVYFRKPEAEEFFTFVKHARDNYRYFCNRYYCRGSLYRNDYAFSFAQALYTDFRNDLRSLPNERLLTALHHDRIEKVKENRLIISAKDNKDYVPVSVEQNVHIFNKFNLQNYLDEIIEIHE